MQRWVRNEPITKNGVLTVTTLCFWKFCFSLRTSYKELIWCANYQNVHIYTFCKAGVLFEGTFSLWVCLIPPYEARLAHRYFLGFNNRCKGALSGQFEKIHRSTFQQIEDISIVFLRSIWCQSVRKTILAKVQLTHAE